MQHVELKTHLIIYYSYAYTGNYTSHLSTWAEVSLLSSSWQNRCWYFIINCNSLSARSNCRCILAHQKICENRQSWEDAWKGFQIKGFRKCKRSREQHYSVIGWWDKPDLDKLFFSWKRSTWCSIFPARKFCPESTYSREALWYNSLVGFSL